MTATKTRHLTLALLALTAAAGGQSVQGPTGDRWGTPATPTDIGVNVAKLGFEGGGISRSELPFSDLMKVAHGFDAVDQGDVYPQGSSVVPYRQVFANLDEDGYPCDVVPFNGYV